MANSLTDKTVAHPGLYMDASLWQGLTWYEWRPGASIWTPPCGKG